MVDEGADEPGTREYRIDDLAEAAGVPVRTVRYYQERRLLPAPRRSGRLAWYSEAHLARLRVIARLLERGHTLGGIAELLSAWEKGRDVADLLGFEEAVTAPWGDDAPVRMSWEELSAAYGHQVTPEALREAEELGYIRDEGAHVAHLSRRLLETSTTLVREGIPLSAVLRAGRDVQDHADRLAALFVDLVRRHLVEERDELPSTEEIARLTRIVERLRPVAETTVLVEFARAMDRRIGDELGEILRSLHAPGGEAQDDGAARR
ncbi:DNA-binding transcriptional MerR regulator [Spinactinospora alkalitolerans]|uniref:DNA-binding transcriptional MerR regulator n=1 Tax=Spinactinospora alkalitolerans TaxID=687207 RepID=A0A852U070_9ACTN|nr:MerR family transcriptional regulator [Spinactinospora alkalitolerans]NYE47604.1 DNA-binding transcriptional MerR regulator [Spinactinospora alkalitolerans]